MFELKIKKIDNSLNFGWQFESQQEAEDFLSNMQSRNECPYKPIMEYDEEGNILSLIPNPEWEITITAL